MILRRIAEKECVPGEVQPVFLPGKSQSPAAFARPVEKILPLVGAQLRQRLSVPQEAHLLRAPHRLQTPQQHGGGFTLRSVTKVQAAVHSIDQVDVRMARGTEHNGVRWVLW